LRGAAHRAGPLSPASRLYHAEALNFRLVPIPDILGDGRAYAIIPAMVCQ
jgi:hypothetical protein